MIYIFLFNYNPLINILIIFKLDALEQIFAKRIKGVYNKQNNESNEKISNA